MIVVLRGLLYVVALFLFAIVYTGQRHTNAADTARAAVGMTGRMLVWSAAGIALMFALQWLFID